MQISGWVVCICIPHNGKTRRSLKFNIVSASTPVNQWVPGSERDPVLVIINNNDNINNNNEVANDQIRPDGGLQLLHTCTFMYTCTYTLAHTLVKAYICTPNIHTLNKLKIQFWIPLNLFARLTLFNFLALCFLFGIVSFKDWQWFKTGVRREGRLPARKASSVEGQWNGCQHGLQAQVGLTWASSGKF